MPLRADEVNVLLIHHLLETQASHAPDRTLLVVGTTQTTYGQIETDANRIAHALGRSGVRPGDRVALLSRNSAFYVSAYYGILKSGAIAVSLNTAADDLLVRELLDDCGARVLLAGASFAAIAGRAAAEVRSLACAVIEGGTGTGAAADPETPSRVTTAEAFLAGADGGRPEAARSEDAPAMIVYTSGSTGRPRGATLTHRNVVSNTRSIVSYLGLGADDRVLDVLPFHYVYGKSLLNTHVATGGSLVIEESLLFPDTILDRMNETQVTGLSGVPSTFAILLNRSSIASRTFPTLRYVTQAGGAMPVEHTRRLIDALPGVAIYIMYGATEASARLAYLSPQDLERKLGSIGKAIPGVHLELVTEEGRLARPGETGEIVARGDNIMQGYWNDEDETRAVMSARGLHTGDLARADDEGFLYVVGRKRDMIKAGANRISAREVEEVIITHAAVEEAAVIGVPDEMLGEAVYAFVTARPGASADVEEIVDFLRERLPAYKVPKRIEVLDELPRTGSGKVDKEALRGHTS